MDYFLTARKFRAKKRLGQNFLVDGSCIEKIIEVSDLQPSDTVLEIGAGLGFVTRELVSRAKRVIAVELDKDMVRELEKINAQNLEIINQDILKTDISQFGSNIKIVANIPYYITTPILVHLLGEIDDLENKNRNSISQIVLMVQYEVAKRIMADEKAEEKEWGLLSILSKFWAEVEFIKKVPAKSFFPAPKVDSAVLKFKVRTSPMLELEDYTFFRKTAKACFATRRKNLKNSLLNAGFTKENIQKTLSELNIPENIRGEKLSILEISKLAEGLKANQQ